MNTRESGEAVGLDQLSACTGFEWDEENSEKNSAKHRVARLECEHVFFNLPLVVADDEKHSQDENRLLCLGSNRQGKEAISGVHNPEQFDSCDFSPRYESE
jgi:uncharacterized DUF497 family protein